MLLQIYETGVLIYYERNTNAVSRVTAELYNGAIISHGLTWYVIKYNGNCDEENSPTIKSIYEITTN